MNAFWPHGALLGELHGAKADTEENRSAFFRCKGQCTVPAHRVTGNALPPHVGRKIIGHHRAQLVEDVPVHPVVRRPGGLGCAEVEAGPLAEVVGIIVGHVITARAGIGRDDHDAVLGGGPLNAGFLHHVRPVARQSRQIPQHRHRPLRGLRRCVDCEGHRALACVTDVLVHAQAAAEADPARFLFHIGPRAQ